MTESLRRGLLDALKICLMGACLLLVPAHPGEAETLATEALTCPSCDDFNACTIDSCDTTTGTCRHDPRSCDDHNPCTADSCDPRPEPYGGCRRAFLPTGSTCDDGNACSSNDACDGAGTCVGVAQAAGSACDDGNPCTGSDACSDAGLCGGTPLAPGTECDDHDACTSGERCALVSGAVVCQGNVKNCDDGALCTEDRCDPITGQCVNAPVACDDGNSCTLDACDPATGACTHGNTTGSCEDGNFCSVNDYCSGGNCLSGGPRDCGQPQCGSYFCRPDLQICQFNDSSGPSCPAAPQCNYYVCVNGSCQLNQQPFRYPCSDGNPCTVEYCVRGDCQLQLFRSGQSCDDGSLCTLNDVCNGFNCTGTPKCDDGNRCTQDLCDASTGTCLGTQPTNCDDGNPCTDDSCDPVGGCQHVQVSCDDGNVCTTDSCDPVRGCQHVQVSCDDGSLCTLDSCDPATGACLHRFDPNQSDLDVDGVPDACDDCPTVFNPGQDPNACKEEIVDISIGFGSPLGGGSGMVGWRTTHEVTLTGFNIVVLGRDGGTTRLNQAPIPCTACGTGNGTTYNYPIPKHKSGRNIFIEMLRADVVLGTFGPAVKQ